MRVLAINDISCVGKCSLTAALPIISACGIECTVLPTAVLSTHTGGFEGYTFRDLTDDFSDVLSHWKKLGLKFDYIYSGYLGSIHQIELVSSIKNQFLDKNGVFIVDPVMGDSGTLYAGFSQEYVNKMRELCKEADFILPNMTEACYLADFPYPLNKTSAEQALEKLALLCPIPVITGITDSDGISVFFKDGLGNAHTLSHENTEGFFCGAGDVFASAFIGCMARGKNVEEAIRLASDFAAACIRRSAKEVPDKRFGLPFEAELYPFLQKLNG